MPHKHLITREGTNTHSEDESDCKADPNRRDLEKRLFEVWVFISDNPSEGPNAIEALLFHNTNHSDHNPVSPKTFGLMRHQLRRRTSSRRNGRRQI